MQNAPTLFRLLELFQYHVFQLKGLFVIALGITFQVDLGDLSVLNGKMEDLASGKDEVLNGILSSGSPNDVSTAILSIATGMQALRSDNTTLGESLRYN